RHVEPYEAPPAGHRRGLIVIAGAAEVGADDLEAREVIGERLEVERAHVGRGGLARAHAGIGIGLGWWLAAGGGFARLLGLFFRLAHPLCRLGVPARVALYEVDAAANDAAVAEDWHPELLGRAVSGVVVAEIAGGAGGC